LEVFLGQYVNLRDFVLSDAYQWPRFGEVSGEAKKESTGHNRS